MSNNKMAHLLSRLRCSRPRPRFWVPEPRLISPKTKSTTLIGWKNHYSRNSDVQSWKWWSNNNDEDITGQWSAFNDSTVNTWQRLVNKALCRLKPTNVRLQLLILWPIKQPKEQDQVSYAQDRDFEKRVSRHLYTKTQVSRTAAVQNGAITVEIQKFCNVYFVANLILNTLWIFDYSDVTNSWS